MGWVLSKFRKSKSTMEVLTKLESEINGIIEFKASTAQTQKKVVGHLVTYSIVIYLLVAIFAYFKLFPAAKTTKDQLFLLLPFLISPLLIWGLRKLLTWWYHSKIIRNEKKLELLKKRKLKILDEVMETETYRVAKEILDKFGDKSVGAGGTRPLPGLSAVFKPGTGPGSGPNDNQLRRRTIGDPVKPSLNTSLPVSSTGLNKPGNKLNTSMSVTSGARPGPGPLARPGPAGPSGPSQPGQQPGPGGPPRPPPSLSSGGRPGPPLPRPILPRERGYLDKFVEFLVGDGPSNRYALICRQCESHNGMALREEFEYVAYRCCYCYYWNPARKQRPVAPRLTAAAERPLPTSNSSESSGSDVSAPNSTANSRRSSISKIENKGDESAVVKADCESVKEDGSKVEEVTEIIETGDKNEVMEESPLLPEEESNPKEITKQSDIEPTNERDNNENVMEIDN